MRSKVLASFVAAALLSVPAEAAPFKPERDDEVVLTLPRVLGPRQQLELARLEQAHMAAPRDAELAERLAQEYLAIGRRDGDPRYYGMARAAILPWSAAPDAPVGMVELRAEILGFAHDFAGALEAYDEVLAREPGRSSASLARGVLKVVTGDLGGAAKDCALLAPGTVESLGCRMTIELTKEQGGEALLLFANGPTSNPWILELGAEAAALAGDGDRAARLFAESLSAEDRVFTRIAYADFFLRRGRARDALQILPNDSRNLGVMVRRAAALTLGDPQSSELKALRTALEGTFELERDRGDAIHGREYALYLLHVARDPRAALPVARANYEKQKERIDQALLQEAEAAAR